MSAPSPGLPSSLETLFADSPEAITLDNGLKVVFQPKQSHPVVSVQAWIKSGSIHEDDHLGCGLSHFLEHMLFKGTRKRGPGDIAAEVQALGGNINAYTAFDRTVYYIDGPSESLGQILELLHDQTLNASLPEEEVEKERDVILREIDDPDRIVGRALFATAYNNHPFRYPVIGLRPLFESVDRESLLRYYHERYQPDNMVLTVAGQFDRDELMEQVQATFGSAPRKRLKPVHVTPEPPQLARRESRLYGDYQTARGLMAFKVPSMRHEDSPAMDIIAAIIGAGHSGRLRQRLREEQNLVHGISASVWNPVEPGLFFIQYHCGPETANQVEDAILECCRDFVENGFSQAELDKARTFAFVSEVQARQTSSGLASRLGLVSSMVGDLHYPKRYFEIIQSLRPEDLQRLAARIFREERLSVSTLFPESCRPAPASAQSTAAYGAFEEKTLPNGARLYWQVDQSLPRTWMRFAGLGGPCYEDHDKRGSTSLLTTLLNRDTRSRSAFEIADQLESEGCFMADASGNNTFALSVEALPTSIGTGIKALREALTEPAFLKETLDREKEAQIAHLKSLDDDVMDYGRQALRRHFFGQHPFADHPCGRIETATQLDAAKLGALKDRLLVGPNAVLVIAGDFDPETVLPELEDLLMQLPEGSFETDGQTLMEPATTGSITEHLDREQAVVFEAYPDIGAKPDESIVGDVLCELLSDMSGPLFKSVREERSLAYYVGASRLLGINHGCFYLYAGTHPSATEEVFSCFETELKRIRDGGVTEEELSPVRTRLKVAKRFSLQSPGTRASMASLNALFGKPVMDWLDYEKRVDGVSAESVARFASEILRQEGCLRLTVTPN
jgi:zinc protease